MRWGWLIVLGGCATAGPLTTVSTPPVEPVTLSFALTFHEQSIAGLGLLRALPEEPDGYELIALSPMGTQLFAVTTTGEATNAEAVDPKWARALERMPFHRDLALVLTRCRDGQERCHTGRGSLAARDGRWRYRGTGGGAWVTRDDAGVLVEDPLRGYTLRVNEVSQ